MYLQKREPVNDFFNIYEGLSNYVVINQILIYRNLHPRDLILEKLCIEKSYR